MRMGNKAQMLCSGCARPVPQERHFCPHCGAPMSFYATTAPYERVLSEGYAWRRAASRPNLIIVIGMWLIWSPTLAFCLFVPFMGFYSFATPADLGGQSFKDITIAIPGVLLFGGGGWIAARLLHRVTKAYQEERNRRRNEIEDDEGTASIYGELP